MPFALVLWLEISSLPKKVTGIDFSASLQFCSFCRRYEPNTAAPTQAPSRINFSLRLELLSPVFCLSCAESWLSVANPRAVFRLFAVDSFCRHADGPRHTNLCNFPLHAADGCRKIALLGAESRNALLESILLLEFLLQDGRH